MFFSASDDSSEIQNFFCFSISLVVFQLLYSELGVFHPQLTLCQLIQPDLESRFIVRSQLGLSIQSGSSPGLQVVTQFTHTVPKFVSKVAGLQVHATTQTVRVVNKQPLTFVFLQLLMKRFIQAEARKTFHNSNIPKRLSKLLFFSMAVATCSGTILVSC